MKVNGGVDLFRRSLLLPNNPLKAKWLSGRVKYIVIQRKAADNTGIESKDFKKGQAVEAFTDVKPWLCGLRSLRYRSQGWLHEVQHASLLRP